MVRTCELFMMQYLQVQASVNNMARNGTSLLTYVNRVCCQCNNVVDGAKLIKADTVNTYNIDSKTCYYKLT